MRPGITWRGSPGPGPAKRWGAHVPTSPRGVLHICEGASCMAWGRGPPWGRVLTPEQRQGSGRRGLLCLLPLLAPFPGRAQQCLPGPAAAFTRRCPPRRPPDHAVPAVPRCADPAKRINIKDLQVGTHSAQPRPGPLPCVSQQLLWAWPPGWLLSLRRVPPCSFPAVPRPAVLCF